MLYLCAYIPYYQAVRSLRLLESVVGGVRMYYKFPPTRKEFSLFNTPRNHFRLLLCFISHTHGYYFQRIGWLLRHTHTHLLERKLGTLLPGTRSAIGPFVADSHGHVPSAARTDLGAPSVGRSDAASWHPCSPPVGSFLGCWPKNSREILGEWRGRGN